MASSAHAYFCFEVLSASYDDRRHPDLESVIALYEEHQSELSAVEEHGRQTPDNEEGGRSDEPGEGVTRPLSLPSIARLQGSTPSSRSSTSTPSSVSVNSSRSHLTSTTVSSTPPSYASRLSVIESYPLFVTWNVLSRSGNKHLRGCIGTFEPMPLEKGLESYALASAFEDTRFTPISVSALPTLSCSLTLLADFEQCAGPMDWELGKHGIRISFTNRYRRLGATYLPDVAVEQGWTKAETLESLMRKAGWEGSSRRILRASSEPWEEVKDFRVVRYTGLKASALYGEWLAWQRWAKEKNPEAWS